MTEQMQELLAKTGKGLGPYKGRLARHIVVLLGYVLMTEAVAAHSGEHSREGAELQMQAMSSCLKELGVHIGLSEQAFDELLVNVAREVQAMFLEAALRA